MDFTREQINRISKRNCPSYEIYLLCLGLKMLARAGKFAIEKKVIIDPALMDSIEIGASIGKSKKDN